MPLRMPDSGGPCPAHTNIRHGRRRTRQLSMELSELPRPIRHPLRIHIPSVISLRLHLLSILVVSDDNGLGPEIVPNLTQPTRHIILAHSTSQSVTFKYHLLH